MIAIDCKTQCCGCSACANICPVSCITMQEDDEGFLYPVVEGSKCIHCGKCRSVCPLLKEPLSSSTLPEAYAAYYPDPIIRQQSSSGGVFTVLAEAVLQLGGTVLGAASEPISEGVRHIAVNNSENLSLLRGSKYTQSDLGDTFRQTRDLLKKGQYVLFSGTACQIAGLRGFLGKDYPTLICLDVICHGVPSPKALRSYLRYLQTRYGSDVRELSFRDKSNGWKDYQLRVTCADGQVHLSDYRTNPYMCAFLSDAVLRPSCHECGFKGFSRHSDITLGDFWGIESVAPQLDDNKGTSLVILHSEKGRKLFKQVLPLLTAQAVPLEQAVAQNPAMVRSVPPHPLREETLGALEQTDFGTLCKKFLPKRPSLIRKFLSKMRGVLRRLRK